MALEIERKYLVPYPDSLPQPERILVITQGYLRKGGNEATVRIRRCDDQGYITIKAAKGSSKFTRQEYEYPIPASDADALLQLCHDRVITKERWLIRHEGWLWEVDHFGGDNAGLWLAEVELPNEDAIVPLPSWVGREVTGNAEYYNSFLSRHPYCTWIDGMAPMIQEK